MFTSLEALARFAGPCSWASTTAADALDLLPDGCRILVDPLGRRPLLLGRSATGGAEGGGRDE
nr:hypothetical protein [Streptomyces sp. I05A-00742]